MANNTPVNQAINSSSNAASKPKQINKPLRYGVLFGWFFTLFIAVTSTGLVAYYKVVKTYLAKDTTVLTTPTPSPSPEIVVDTANLLEEAKAALQAGNTEQALEKLTQFIQTDTTNAEAYKLQADALVSSNRYEEAIEMSKALIAAKENVNEQDNDGWTALMYAIRDNNTEFIDTLLKAGANIKLKNKAGQTAETIAQDRKRTEVIELLASDKK